MNLRRLGGCVAGQLGSQFSGQSRCVEDDDVCRQAAIRPHWLGNCMTVFCSLFDLLGQPSSQEMPEATNEQSHQTDQCTTLTNGRHLSVYFVCRCQCCFWEDVALTTRTAVVSYFYLLLFSGHTVLPSGPGLVRIFVIVGNRVCKGNQASTRYIQWSGGLQ